MYVLDEPSIGLHQRDNDRLLETLKNLRDIGNTVLVVEHDEDAIRSADYVIDIGPGAGVHGGSIVAEGTPSRVAANPASLTGDPVRPQGHRKPAPAAEPAKQLKVIGAHGNNPARRHGGRPPGGLFTCITGVSGSGKSTLINDTLYAVPPSTSTAPAPNRHRTGNHRPDLFDKVINVDQAPIGRTPRSNPATYTGLLTRSASCSQNAGSARAATARPFQLQRQGRALRSLPGRRHDQSRDALPARHLRALRRLPRQALQPKKRWKSVQGQEHPDILGMTVEEARGFFDAVPTVARKLRPWSMSASATSPSARKPATTLSGGEAQRVKLALELSSAIPGAPVHPRQTTTGLHFPRISRCCSAVLQRLADHSNTIVVIRHNLDVIKTADWIVDLGPRAAAAAAAILVSGRLKSWRNTKPAIRPLPQTATGKIGMSHEPPKSAIDEFKGKKA